jgi:DNA-binding PucR family transcriptional regulator
MARPRPPVLECALVGADAATRAVIASKSRALQALAPPDRDIAAITIRAFAGCDMNVARTAAQLYVHPNTVRHRLARIAETIEHDPRTYAGLTELICILDLDAAQDEPAT